MSVAADHDRRCLELTSALCARLCHDLSSPLGTVAGTLELAAEDPSTTAEAVAVAMESAAAAVARLDLLRAAWAGDCGPMSRGRLSQLAAGLPPRIRTELGGLPDRVFDGPHARIFLNMLLLGADTLPRGGEVALAGDLPTGVILTVAGPSVAWDARLAAILADPAAAGIAEPRMVQMPFTARLVHAAGLRLSFLMPLGQGTLQGASQGPRPAPRLLLAPP